MTVIYLEEYSCNIYAVTFENIGCVRVQKFKDILHYEKNILCVKPLGMVLGKSEICRMTEVAGAYDKGNYDGNTILLKISEENDKQRLVYMGGDKVCSFLTIDDKYKYISNMGNNLTPNSFAIGDEYIHFLTPHFKFIKREMIKNDEIMNKLKKSVNPYDLHVSRCGKNLFKKLKIYKFHSKYQIK